LNYTHGGWTALMITVVILLAFCEGSGQMDIIKGWP